jgi:hypothetical protein
MLYNSAILCPNFSNLSDQKEKQLSLFTRTAVLLILMNVIDGILTIVWVCSDRAIEVNPLMSLALDIHPAIFMGIKIALVNLGAVLLVRYFDKMISIVSLYFSVIAYSFILFIHGNFILRLAFS